MVSPNRIAEIAAAIGEPARAAMVIALMDGRALTAGELSAVAGVTPQTASSHLARLQAAGLVAVERQGRHRYHRLASLDAAQLLESVMQVATQGANAITANIRVGPRDGALRRARTCYDHLAGRLGVAMSDALIAQGFVDLQVDGGVVSASGILFLAEMGIVVPERGDNGRPIKRQMCRPCLDWSERRPHLAGRLGAAICSRAFAGGWVRRVKDSRALEVTPAGHRALREVFAISRFE